MSATQAKKVSTTLEVLIDLGGEYAKICLLMCFINPAQLLDSLIVMCCLLVHPMLLLELFQVADDDDDDDSIDWESSDTESSSSDSDIGGEGGPQQLKAWMFLKK